MANLRRTTVALDADVLRKIDELPGSRASHIDAALVAYLTARRKVLHGATTMARDSDPASQNRGEECFLTREQTIEVVKDLAAHISAARISETPRSEAEWRRLLAKRVARRIVEFGAFLPPSNYE